MIRDRRAVPYELMHELSTPQQPMSGDRGGTSSDILTKFSRFTVEEVAIAKNHRYRSLGRSTSCIHPADKYYTKSARSGPATQLVGRQQGIDTPVRQFAARDCVI
jgi:hypothetical protein